MRARAHPLHPVVIVGGDGLSESVLVEIERNLSAHELIKIRVPDAERDDREAMLQSICEHTGSSPVQHIGKVLVVYRPRPEEKKKRVRRPAARAGRPRRQAPERASRSRIEEPARRRR